MFNEKRGYFFVLDAVLGLFVLIIGVFVVTSSYVGVQQPTQVKLLSDDLLGFLSKTKIKNINNPYTGIGGELWNQGDISDGDNTLLQQIGEFYYLNKADTAEKFIQNTTKDVVPAQFRYEVWVDNALLYPKTPTPEHIASKDKTLLLLTSKKITFGVLDKSTGELWGPYKAEVFLWEK